MASSPSPVGAAPEVTVAVAAYNCEQFLADAVASALSQNVDLEVLIVDDASTDGTAQVAERLAGADPRVRLLRLPANAGPAGARNMALDHARGRWFAILDGDDLMEAGRLRSLLTLAEQDDADLVADDLTLFYEGGETKPHRFLTNRTPGGREWLSLAEYLRSSRMFSGLPNVGYLKPLIRLEALNRHCIRYDDRLRIGEDDKFIFQMLLAGMRYRLSIVPGYRYRKHEGSISHRMSQANIDRIFSITEEMGSALPTDDKAVRLAFAGRMRSVRRARGFTYLLDHLKARSWAAAWAEIVANPSILPMLHMPLRARIGRLVNRFGKPKQVKQGLMAIAIGLAATLTADPFCVGAMVAVVPGNPAR